MQSFFLLCLLAGLSKLFCDTLLHKFPAWDASNNLRRGPLEPVVLLSAPRGYCTAFKVDEDLGIHFGISQPNRDYWLTAQHCCLEADSVMSLKLPGKSIPVKKFLDDPISDYCILDTQKTAIQGLTLGTFQPAFPASDFEVWSLERRTTVHINSTFFLDDKRMQIGLDYPGKPGESGEPLLWNNQVMGLTSGGRGVICFFSLVSGIRDVSFNRNYQNIFFNTPFHRKKASYHGYSITNEGAHRATKVEIEENLFLGWTLSPERIRSAKERTQTFSDVIWTYKNFVAYPNGIETAEVKRSVNQPQGNFTYFDWKFDSQLVSAKFFYEDFPNGATLEYYQYKKYLNNTSSAQSLHYLGTKGEDFLHNHWKSDNGTETSQKTEVREQGKIKFIHKQWAQNPKGIQTALHTEEFEPYETKNLAQKIKYALRTKKYYKNLTIFPEGLKTAVSKEIIYPNGMTSLSRNWTAYPNGTESAQTLEQRYKDGTTLFYQQVANQNGTKTAHSLRYKGCNGEFFVYHHWKVDPQGTETAQTTEEIQNGVKLISTNWVQYPNGTQSVDTTQRELLAPIEEQGILPGDATFSPTTRSY